MKYFEQRIQEFDHKAKEIEESHEPTVLKANKLLQELSKERLEAQLLARRDGKPSVEGSGHLSRYFRSMGIAPYNMESPAQHATASYGKYAAILERMGFPEKCCEKITVPLAMLEAGDLLKPDLIFINGGGCDAEKLAPQSLSDWFNIPRYYVEVPLNEDDKPNLANLNYVAEQFGEFIEWAGHKNPRIKYDEARHLEMMEADKIAQKYRREIHKLTKHVPCPISPQEVFGAAGKAYATFEPSRYPNIQKGVEYLRIYLDELGERVASGKGPYPEERLRLLWAGQSHSGQVLTPHKLLIERKVAMPVAMHGNDCRGIGLRCEPYGEMSEYGIKLSLLQEEARTLDITGWGGPGKRWVNDTMNAARDIGAHGIIHFLLVGCTPMRGMGSVVAERAEKELGIPTLNIEGRQMDREFMSQERFEEILSTFIDKCFDWAGKPRQ